VPQLPDLTDADPQVAAAIKSAYDKVLQQPADGRAWGRLGMVLRAHDFATEANRAFEQAERLDPSEPRWPYLRGRTLVLNNPADGIAALERAAECCGDDPLAPRLRLVEALLENGRLDEASVHLDTVLRIDPANRRAGLDRGRLALQREQWQTALKHLERCLDDVRTRRVTRQLRATIWNQLHEPERAREEQQQASRLPQDEPWHDLFVEEVLALQTGLQNSLRQAGSLVSYRRHAEAIRLLEQTVREYPQSTAAWLQLADTWQQVKRLDRAEAAFREATRADANSVDAWFGLGYVQAERGRSQDAADSFRRAIHLKADHAMAHFHLGVRLKELGDEAGAADAFRTALRCRPDYAQARSALRELKAKP
jgi:tetratricopeptide (TPR) repeat protein